MIKVIINADDLGISDVVNRCIERALSENLISSSTILANTPFWSDVRKIVNSYPHASFGVHLNATYGRALTNSAVLKEFKIVDNSNNFTKEIKRIKKFSSKLLSAIFEEWDTQIQFIKENGICISHIDGHHHVHTIAGLLPILLKLKKKHRIVNNRNKYVLPKYKRVMLNGGINQRLINVSPKIYKKNILNQIYSRISSRLEDFFWKRKIYISGGVMTDYFDAYQSICNRLEEGMSIPDFSSIELMCHPGHINYQDEFDEIIKKRLSTLLKSFNLISYNQLSH